MIFIGFLIIAVGFNALVDPFRTSNSGGFVQKLLRGYGGKMVLIMKDLEMNTCPSILLLALIELLFE